MHGKDEAELEALRDLAKAVAELRGGLPPVERFRRDRGGALEYSPHTLSLFRSAWRKLNVCKRFRSTEDS
jgi:hypothetical protein